MWDLLVKRVVEACYRLHPKDGEGNVFSLFTWGGEVRRPGPDGGAPRYLPSSQVRMGEGVPQGIYTPGQGTYPPARSGWGVPQGTSPRPGQDGGGGAQGTYLPPPAKVPTPRDRTAYRVLDTLRSVCLLRSRRRTFLFNWWSSTNKSDKVGSYCKLKKIQMLSYLNDELCWICPIGYKS